MSPDELGLLLVGDPKLEWIIKKKQVLVTWQDGHETEQCLGQLSPCNHKSYLSLWIGRYEDQLLVTLHLPIALRASSSKKPRDMYLVVPSRRLRIGEENASFAAVLSSQISPTLHTSLHTAPLAGCSRLLHIHFSLGEPSYVVMPKQEYRGSVKGTPLRLLSSLKSLSQAHSFDTYINFNSFAQLDLQKICNGLYNGNELRTPEINLDQMYGRAGGGLDLWARQGLPKMCHEHERETSPPPPYEHAASPKHNSYDYPPPLAQPRAVTQSPDPPHKLGAQDRTNVEHISHYTPASKAPVTHITHISLSHHQLESLNAPSPEHHSSQHSSQHACAHESTINTSIQAPLSPKSHTHLSEQFLEHTPSVETGPSLDHSNRPASATIVPQSPPAPNTPYATSFEDSSLIAETLLSPLLEGSQFEATDVDDGIFSLGPNVSVRKRKAHKFMFSDQIQEPPAVSALRQDKRTRQRTIPDEDLSCNVLSANACAITSTSLLSEAIHWPFAAWSSCPDAHLLFRVEIMNLGTAAGRGDTTTFNATRAVCSTRLALNLADGMVASHRQTIIADFCAEDAVREVVSWINAVDREADILVMEHLVSLAQAARKLERSIACGPEQEEKARRSFRLQKASCLLRPCYFVGRRAVMSVES